MEYVNLGSTGLKVSRLCLGTMTYGAKSWRAWVLDEAESRPFIRQAIEAGINFFDTADVYSLGASEEILGRALKDFGPPRDRLVIAAKVFNAMGSDPNQAGLPRKPWITAPIVGASKPGHLDDALAGLKLKLTPEEIARLEEPYAPHAVMGHE
jgi:aryl-alcohol dehydrogenase-like predicted oxidoreductase